METERWPQGQGVKGLGWYQPVGQCLAHLTNFLEFYLLRFLIMCNILTTSEFTPKILQEQNKTATKTKGKHMGCVSKEKKRTWLLPSRFDFGNKTFLLCEAFSSSTIPLYFLSLSCLRQFRILLCYYHSGILQEKGMPWEFACCGFAL